MFGLPTETALLVFGFPVFWVLYTIIFLVRSRNWESESDSGEDVS
jgi:hypothetical protein